MDEMVNSFNREESVYLILEEQIKNNQFKSKEELIERINKLKEYGRISGEENIIKLLELYDNLNKNDEIKLDTKNYKSVMLEESNVIVSKNDDSVIKTNEKDNNINDQFRTVQNEMVASSNDGMVNADMVYDHLSKFKNEELSFIPLSEVLLRDDIDIEKLKRIKFFLSNKYIDHDNYKYDMVNGLFYNPDTDDVLEVRFNDNTLEYEIYRNNELVYDDVDYENSRLHTENKQNVKVRKLTLDNSAFSKIGFLILNISTFIAVSLMLIFLYR